MGFPLLLGKSQPCIHKLLDYDLDNWSILLLLTGVEAVLNVPEGHRRRQLWLCSVQDPRAHPSRDPLGLQMLVLHFPSSCCIDCVNLPNDYWCEHISYTYTNLCVKTYAH